MTASYELRIHDRAGVPKAIITDRKFLRLQYTNVVNDAGLLEFDLSGAHDAIQYLEKDGQIQVWREDTSASIDPYCDFYGLYRKRNFRTPNDAPRGVFTAKCVGQKHFLKRALVAWPANTADRSIFTSDPAETILKLLVRYNATADATLANGRIRTVGTWATNITTAADGATGSTLSIGVAHRNLLEALQEVAAVGGLDFDLVKTAAQSWQFRTMLDDADDLTATVTFAIDWNNMEEPSLVDATVDEPTVAIVGGGDREDAREFAVRTGPNYAAGYDDYEVFVHAVMQTGAGLNAAGDARLNELRARKDLSFNIKQTGGRRYGRDYNNGSLVTVDYVDGPETRKIRSTTVVVTPSGGSTQPERISAEMVEFV